MRVNQRSFLTIHGWWFYFFGQNTQILNVKTCLNNLHPTIKYTFKKAKLIQSNHSQPYQVLNFLESEVILHSHNTVETDIYYKDTNPHYYLSYNSAHPKHCKGNLHLAKSIIVFVSNDEKVEMRSKELKNWLKDCNYPDNVIDQSFYHAKF